MKKLLIYALYSCLLICMALYPGNNIFLTLYAQEPSAFIEKPDIRFIPHDFPYLQPEPNSIELAAISAPSFIVLDKASMTPILQRNSQIRRFPASTVKLATALVALNTFSLTTPLTVKTVIDEEMKMGLVPGEHISLLNLLYGVFLFSANDAAHTIAENDPQGYDHFIEEMNTYAQNLRLTNTHFNDPIGFDDPAQYSTAYDMARLAAVASDYPIILSISSTTSITVADEDYTINHPLYNINQLVGEIPGVAGLKTGTTTGAGENLITYYQPQPEQSEVQRHEHSIIIVVMGSEDRFADTRLLIDFVKNRLSYQSLQ